MPKHPKYVTAEEAVSLINSNDRVYVHSVAAAPQTLIRALADRAPELHDVQIYHRRPGRLHPRLSK